MQTPPASEPPLLLVEQLGIQQGNLWLLQDVSFKVAAGDRIALVGRPSSGKSLLFRLLNGLVSPTQGQICLSGAAAETMIPADRRRQIAWVADPPQFLGRSLQAAITYPLQLQSLPATEIQARLDAALEQLKIPAADLIKTESELPLAERWRGVIARAWTLQPRLLLLDWPSKAQRPDWLDDALSQLQAQGAAVMIALSDQGWEAWQRQAEGREVGWTQILHLGRSRLTHCRATTGMPRGPLLSSVLAEDEAAALSGGDWPEDEAS